MAEELPDAPWITGNSELPDAPWITAPEKPAGYSTGEGLFDAAVQGVPIVGPLLRKAGAAAAAGMQPLFGQNPDTSFGQRYDANLAELEGRSKRFGDEHPVASTVAGLGGGTAALLSGAGAFPAAARAIGMGGGPIWGQMGRGAVSGAGIGAGDAALRGEDPLAGGVVGSVVGGVAPPLANVAGRAIGAVKNTAGRLVRPAEDEAANKVLSGLAREGVAEPQALAAKLQELGPEGMIADLGPNLQQQAAAIASTPGAGQKVVREALTGRNKGAGERVTAATDQALGAPADIGRLADEIVTRRKEIAAPLYREAYQQPVEVTEPLATALTRPSAKQAIAKAERLALDEGAPLGVNVRSFDLIKRSLDDMVETARRKGENNRARVLGDIRDSLVSEVDRQVPQFAAARQAFASESAIRDALDLGRDAFKANLNPQAMRRLLQGMTEGEREAYQQGARSVVADVMGGSRNDALAARQIFNRGYNQEKLSLLVGEDQAKQLLSALNRETTFSGTAARVTSNSETAARLAGQADLKDQPLHNLSPRDAFTAAGLQGMARASTLRAADRALDALRGNRQAEIEAAMGHILTAKGDLRAAAITRLMNSAQQADRSGELRRRAALAVQAAIRGSQPTLTSRAAPGAR